MGLFMAIERAPAPQGPCRSGSTPPNLVVQSSFLSAALASQAVSYRHLRLRRKLNSSWEAELRCDRLHCSFFC
jgi:hypothetical protein